MLSPSGARCKKIGGELLVNTGPGGDARPVESKSGRKRFFFVLPTCYADSCIFGSRQPRSCGHRSSVKLQEEKGNGREAEGREAASRARHGRGVPSHGDPAAGAGTACTEPWGSSRKP